MPSEGKVAGMARAKVTVTLDRDKVGRVRELLGADSTSGTIDAALSEVLRREQLRGDVAAYSRIATSDDEIALAGLAGLAALGAQGDIADDTDWEALYDDGSR